MPQAAEPTSIVPARDAYRRWAPAVAAWVGVQLLCLVLAAMQTRYSANFPRPAERMALPEMLVVQFAFSAMLSPLLFEGLAATLISIASAIPFSLLAAFVSARTWPPLVIHLCQALLLWLLAIALLTTATRRMRLPGVGAAIAVVIAIGGPILWYLRAEFAGGSASVHWDSDARYGPLLATMLVSGDRPESHTGWAVLLATPAGAGVLLLVSLLLPRREGANRLTNPPLPSPTSASSFSS